jgi:hypothetical protein
MNMKLSGAAALMIGVIGPSIANAAPQPALGYYLATGYVSSATPTAACSAAGVTAGANYTGIFYYPGAGHSSAVLRQAVATASATSVSELKFPTTPAAGTTAWSGTLKAGTEGAAFTSTPFTATFTFLDAASADLSLTVTVSGCSEVWDFALTRTGT